MLSRCLLTKFLHRSSVGSSSRVRCWFGQVMDFSDALTLREFSVIFRQPEPADDIFLQMVPV